jgi:hypothetical protein
VLPDQAGSAAHPHLLIGAGKQGIIYLIDRDKMGHFSSAGDNVVQELQAIGPEFGMPAYYHNEVYFGGVGDPIKAITAFNGALSAGPVSQTANTFAYPGTTPSISADGAANGIVWAIENASVAVVHAYDALNLAHELYNSSQAGVRDQLDAAVKFTVPTVADGRVYVGTQSTLTVFGLLGNAITATGADAGGGPQVNVYSTLTGTLELSFFAYDPHFRGGVRVAVGDLNGDGFPDVVTAPGPGGGPDIRVFDGRTGTLIREFGAFVPNFLGGVNVAVGDVNHDGVPDILVGADAGGGPQVELFSGADGSLLTSFYAYDLSFHGGVRVAVGDVNGDGYGDLITAAGAGGGPHVKVFSGNDGSLSYSFMAYTPVFTGGVYVAAGDTNGDGKADVITGAGAGAGPEVRVFSGATGGLLQDFFAYSPAFPGGVRVGAAAVAGAGHAEILTAAGPDGGPHVEFFDGLTLALLDSFFSYAAQFAGGVFVGGSR